MADSSDEKSHFDLFSGSQIVDIREPTLLPGSDSLMSSDGTHNVVISDGETSASTSQSKLLATREKVKTQHRTLDELAWGAAVRPQEASLGGDDGTPELEEIEGVDVVYEETDGGRINEDEEGVENADEPTPEISTNADGGLQEISTETVDGPLVEEAPETFDSVELLPNWHKFTLNPRLLKSLHSRGFKSPTPIQAAPLPVALSDRDAVGVVHTTERHAALEKSNEVKKGKGKGKAKEEAPIPATKKPPPHISVATIVGGMSAQKQCRFLDRGVDVLVATPSRLWDIREDDGTLSKEIKALWFLVLDEAGRMIEAGHFAELENILRFTLRENKNGQIEAKAGSQSGGEGGRTRKKESKTPSRPSSFRQHSAKICRGMSKSDLARRAQRNTSDKPASTLDDLLLRLDFRDRDPQAVGLSLAGGAVSRLQESKIKCLSADKVPRPESALISIRFPSFALGCILYYFLLRHPGKSLAFLSSINGMSRLMPLAELLNIKAFPLHSQLEQRQRLKTLDKFYPELRSARGLDIPTVNHIIHCQIPQSANAYVHRNGQTARAMGKGFSLLMRAPGEQGVVRALLGNLGRLTRKIEEDEIQEILIELSMLDKLTYQVQITRKIETAHHKIKKFNPDRTAFDSYSRSGLVEMKEPTLLRANMTDSSGEKSQFDLFSASQAVDIREPTLLPGSDSLTSSNGAHNIIMSDSETSAPTPRSLRVASSSGSRPSDSQLNAVFKFSSMPKVPEVPAMYQQDKPPRTLADIIPPPSHIRPLSNSSIMEEDNSLRRFTNSKGWTAPCSSILPLSVVSRNALNSSMREDDATITMLGGGHVRHVSINASKPEKRKHSAIQPRGFNAPGEYREFPSKTKIVEKPSIASTSSLSFGGERMIKARRRLLGRQSLKDSYLIAVREDLQNLSPALPAPVETLDFDKTLNAPFMESVWRAFSEIFEKQMVYRGHCVLPYSTGCTTPLLNFEAGQACLVVNDPAGVLPCMKYDPVDLPSNLALCVHPDFIYIKIHDQDHDQNVILHEKLLKTLYKDPKKAKFKKIGQFQGSNLKSWRYIPLFDCAKIFDGRLVCSIPQCKYEDKAFGVLVDTYVTDADGTGIVHQAPANHRIAFANGFLSAEEMPLCPVDGRGIFTKEVPDFGGLHVKATDSAIQKVLKAKGRLIVQSTINHSYPHCWRSGPPLIYRAIPAQFVHVQAIVDDLVAQNEGTRWNRYWGTPIPLRAVYVGSVEELERLSGVTGIPDLHREKIDRITIPSQKGKGQLKRVDEVFDCWFELGRRALRHVA
ncbi:hypothetical protein DXG01_002006 [Tephrocybe rancida]|nr:hypothetical protein DXG01_002006 [Tephrocybe rancida]